MKSIKFLQFQFNLKHPISLYLYKWLLIFINFGFVLLTLIISSIVWTNLNDDDYRANLNQSMHSILSEENLEQIVLTRKCGIILIGIIVFTISMIGILGAFSKNITALFFYDFLIGFVFILILLGWRNYRPVFEFYLIVLFLLIITFILTLILVKILRFEPIRIRKEMLLNHVNTRESFIF